MKELMIKLERKGNGRTKIIEDKQMYINSRHKVNGI